MLTVVGAPQTRTRRVLWALEELGLAYENAPHAPHAEEVFELTGAGKIPALIDGNLVLTDSLAILHYLADKHGQLTYPAGSLERARQDAMTFRILDEVEGPLWMVSKHKFIHPKDKRVPEAMDSFRWETARALTRLGESLGDKPFLNGEVFTVTDILATHLALWAKSARVVAKSDALTAYIERMTARPAAQKIFAL